MIDLFRTGRRKLTVGLATLALASAGVTFGATPSASAASTCTKHFRSYITANNGINYPATSTYSTNCILGNGNANDAVYWLQYSLRYCNGFGTLAVDGIYGSRTASAVRSVQSSHHISVDGVYGPQTRSVMRWAATNDVTDARTCH